MLQARKLFWNYKYTVRAVFTSYCIMARAKWSKNKISLVTVFYLAI